MSNKIKDNNETITSGINEDENIALDQPCQGFYNGVYKAIEPGTPIVAEEELTYHDGTANKNRM